MAYSIIYQTEIHPMDGVIWPPNNWGQMEKYLSTLAQSPSQKTFNHLKRHVHIEANENT